MARFRIGLGLAALVVLGIVFATVNDGSTPMVTLAFWALSILTAITAIGLVRARYLARWMAIALGWSVLPIAGAIMLDPPARSDVRPLVTLLAGATIFVALLGRSMFAAFEGRSSTHDWSGGRMGLVRWAIIANLATSLSLSLATLQWQSMPGKVVVWCGSFALILLLSIGLLARQKTLGILLLAVGCVGILGSGSYFMVSDAAPWEAVMLLSLMFGPGVVLGSAVLVAYAKPILAFVRR